MKFTIVSVCAADLTYIILTIFYVLIFGRTITFHYLYARINLYLNNLCKYRYKYYKKYNSCSFITKLRSIIFKFSPLLHYLWFRACTIVPEHINLDNKLSFMIYILQYICKHVVRNRIITYRMYTIYIILYEF